MHDIFGAVLAQLALLPVGRIIGLAKGFEATRGLRDEPGLNLSHFRILFLLLLLSFQLHQTLRLRVAILGLESLNLAPMLVKLQLEFLLGICKVFRIVLFD